MSINGHDLAEHFRGAGIMSVRRADSVGLKKSIEAETRKSFSAYLSNRRASYHMKSVVRSWVVSNFQDILDEFPYAEANERRERVVHYTTKVVFWHMVCQEFGEDRAIAVRNKIYQSELREEFLAEGAETSTRDFTYLLDLI